MIAGAARTRDVRIGDRIFNDGAGNRVGGTADSRGIDHSRRLIKTNKPGIEPLNGIVSRTRCVRRSCPNHDIVSGQHTQAGRSRHAHQEVSGSAERHGQAYAAVAGMDRDVG